MRIFTITLTLLILIGSGATWLYWHEIQNLVNETSQTEEKPIPAPIPDPETYAVLAGEVEFHRKKLAAQYLAAQTVTEQNKVLSSARNFLELTMPELMSCWLGTPWDYNGMASIPGNGKVACGYFVSTIMRDSGFGVHRIRLAQQPSQNILRTFLPRDQLEIKVDAEYDDYMQTLRNGERGIYIIGLDQHVGFLINAADGLHFIHSGGVYRRVVNESIPAATSIQNSRYRVIGHLTGNLELLRKWLLQKPFPTQI